MVPNPQLTTFLMFTGQAQQALDLYLATFENSRLISMKLYGPGEMGKEGTVHLARFSLNGQEFMCIDSPVQHAFNFTPSISIYVSSPDEAKITRYFENLSPGGQILMPLGEYPFSRKFAWINDRFGVSWQLATA